VEKKGKTRGMSLYNQAGILAFPRDRPDLARPSEGLARTGDDKSLPSRGRKEHGGCKVHSCSAAPLSCAVRMTRAECAPTSKAPTAAHRDVPLVRARARVQERQKGKEKKREKEREREREREMRCTVVRGIGGPSESHTHASERVSAASERERSFRAFTFLSLSLCRSLARSLAVFLFSSDGDGFEARDRIAEIRYR